MIRKFTTIVAAGLALAMTLAVAGPVAAQDSRQRDKNNMRNLGMLLGAAAVHQGVKGKRTNALILGAGALYSAKKYEDQRKAQNRDNSWRQARYYESRYSRGYDDSPRYYKSKGKKAKKSKRGRHCR